MKIGITKSTTTKFRRTCEEKSSVSKILVSFVPLFLVAASLCLILSSCSGSTNLSGVWIQETTSGEKVLTISDQEDSYSLSCSDGTELVGAIYQNGDYSGSGKAYDFYLAAPSVMTSDPKSNEMNYEGLLHETMYFSASGDTKADTESMSVSDAAAMEDTSRKLEGNGDSEGNATVLDGIWRKQQSQ